LHRNYKEGTIMTSTIIIPNKSMVSIPVPHSYIGRQLEITFALVEKTNKTKPEIKLSDMFRGVLLKESVENFMEHIKTMRNE